MNCAGPLICGFFQYIRTTVLHDPQLVESVDVELWIRWANCKVTLRFSTEEEGEGLVLLTPALFKDQLFIVVRMIYSYCSYISISIHNLSKIFLCDIFYYHRIIFSLECENGGIGEPYGFCCFLFSYLT